MICFLRDVCLPLSLIDYCSHMGSTLRDGYGDEYGVKVSKYYRCVSRPKKCLSFYTFVWPHSVAERFGDYKSSHLSFWLHCHDMYITSQLCVSAELTINITYNAAEEVWMKQW
jgi:hypothetical protein